MQPILLEGAKNYGAPLDWDHERDGACHVLPVIETGRLRTSVWSFTPAERRQIAQGQNIVVQLVGFQVPIALSVADVQGSPAWEPNPMPMPEDPHETLFMYIARKLRGLFRNESPSR